MKDYFKISLLFLFITANASDILAHKQRTHQYIVREAYKLLELYYGCKIPILSNAIGNTQDGGFVAHWPADNGHPWIDGKVVSGAFREDEEDVMYGYGNGIGDITRYAWASITHFWDADAGDEFIDSTYNGLLSIQLGNIRGQEVSFLDVDLTSEESIPNIFMTTKPFRLNKNDSLSIELSIKNKNWNKDVSVKIDIIDQLSGKVIHQISEITDKEKNQVFTIRGFSSQLDNVEANLKVTIDNLDYKNLIVNYLDIMVIPNPLTKNISENVLLTDNLPEEYQLEQNYPNPFNPSTTINYQIPEDGFVTLKIYDILGNEIKTLVEEQKSIGSYQVSFDAGDLSSGIYIYKIQVNEFVSSKKMLLIK